MSAPLVRVVSSDERHITERLECGHDVHLGLPLGRWANPPALRRRCHKCADADSSKATGEAK